MTRRYETMVELMADKADSRRSGSMHAKSVLAGACIALGCAFMSVVKAGSSLGVGPTALLGGLCFSMGLFMVMRCGGELFTGDVLMTTSCMEGEITLKDMVATWVGVYGYNLVGAMVVAALVALCGLDTEPVRAMADAKCALPWHEMVVRGILCNFLVCAAVWMGAGRDGIEAFLACLLPVACFVTCGFEHSVANMFVLAFARGGGWFANLAFVTLGNVVGGIAFSVLQYIGNFGD